MYPLHNVAIWIVFVLAFVPVNIIASVVWPHLTRQQDNLLILCQIIGCKLLRNKVPGTWYMIWPVESEMVVRPRIWRLFFLSCCLKFTY